MIKMITYCKMGTIFLQSFSAQSAIIVPKPGDPNIYFIFTVDTVVQQGQVSNGFNYSEVDMSLNNRLWNNLKK